MRNSLFLDVGINACLRRIDSGLGASRNDGDNWYTIVERVQFSGDSDHLVGIKNWVVGFEINIARHRPFVCLSFLDYAVPNFQAMYVLLQRLYGYQACTRESGQVSHLIDRT